MQRLQTRFGKLGLATLLFLPGNGCPFPPSGNGPDGPPQVDLDITEMEPNDDALTAQASGLADVATVRVLAGIADGDDIDVYALGPLNAGDRITVDVNTSGGRLDTWAVLFDTDADYTLGTVFAASDDDPRETGNLDPFIDEVVRHGADQYFLAIEASFGTTLESGEYEILIGVERGGPAPQPRRQSLLLDFDGGSTTTRAGAAVTIAPFDAAVIDASYAGQTQAIKDVVAATVRENFAGFHVDILNTDQDTPPADGSFSTVFIGLAAGGVIPGGEGLGAALDGTDLYNKNPADDAIVFVENFSPANFGLIEPIEPQNLGVAIGNVASHEAGHLLGLHHVYDQTSLMNTLDAPVTLLFDQRFKRSLLHFTIFDPLSNFLTQDAPLLLRETVGSTQRVANATVAVGERPFAVAAADLDGDGDIDLAVANRLSNHVSLLLNHGDATWAEAVNLDVGAGSSHVVAFDADGDGDLDLMTAHSGVQTLSLLLNDGHGGFGPATSMTAGQAPVELAAADFDHDADLDVAVANFLSNDVSILRNDGSGTFENTADYPVGDSPGHITAADLNGDGAWDLIVSNLRLGDVSLLLGHGDGTFADAITMSAGYLPGGATAADLDGDGDADLAVTNRLAGPFTSQFLGSVSVLTNDGNATFATPAEYFAGGSPESVVAADFDGDGDLDLALACSGDLAVPQDTGQMSVLLNRGDGTFAQDVRHETGSAPQWITAADLNGDDAVDLIVVNLESGNLSIFLNTGDGRFGIPVELGSE